MGLFYVYTYAYPNGNVFYVGKGQDERMFQHVEEALHEGTTLKCAIIRQIWSQGGQVLISKVYETSIETDALLYEWILINLTYGRENLSNLCDGGKSRGANRPNGQDYETGYIGELRPRIILTHKKGGRIIDPKRQSLYVYQAS